MGVKVSKTAEVSPSNDDRNIPNTVERCTHSLARPQTNVNATKNTEYPPELLQSLSQWSLRSSCSICSDERPQVGTSPLPAIEKSIQRTHGESIWTEGRNLDQRDSTTLPTLKLNPPRNPGTILIPSPSNSSDANFQIVRAREREKRAGRPLTGDYQKARRTLSLSTYSSIYHSSLHTGQAHLRRCTAAQQVLAHRPDISDSFSIDCCLSPRPQVHLSHNKPMRLKTKAKLVNKRQSDQLLTVYEPKNRSPMTHTTKHETPKCAGDDRGDTSERHQNLLCSTDNGVPLHYIFYVEDKPELLKLISRDERISCSARNTNCQIHIQAQCRQTIGLGDHSTSDLLRTVEPALFYGGKRVRPVTVTAKNMNDLMKFLKMLDNILPEFGASEFLEKQLGITSASYV